METSFSEMACLSIESGFSETSVSYRVESLSESSHVTPNLPELRVEFNVFEKHGYLFKS